MKKVRMFFWWRLYGRDAVENEAMPTRAARLDFYNRNPKKYQIKKDLSGRITHIFDIL